MEETQSSACIHGTSNVEENEESPRNDFERKRAHHLIDTSDSQADDEVIIPRKSPRTDTQSNGENDIFSLPKTQQIEDTLENADWLEDDFFEKVVKQSSGSLRSKSSPAHSDSQATLLLAPESVDFSPKINEKSRNSCSNSAVSDHEATQDMQDVSSETVELATDTQHAQGATESRISCVNDLSDSEATQVLSEEIVYKVEEHLQDNINFVPKDAYENAETLAKSDKSCISAHKTDPLPIEGHNAKTVCVTNNIIDELKSQEAHIDSDKKESVVSRESVNRTVPSLSYSESITKDAEQISTLLNVKDPSTICEKLADKRAEPNRVEIVTNEMLQDHIDKIEVSVVKEELHNQSSEMTSLLDDVTKVQNMLKACTSRNCVYIDPNEVYMLLESHARKPNRVAVVAAILSNQNRRSNSQIASTSGSVFTSSKNETERDIMEEVELVRRRFPEVDANMIFEMLEVRNERDRVELVLDELAKKSKVNGSENDHDDDCVILSQSNHKKCEIINKGSKNAGQTQDMANDPLYQEMMELSSMFPDKDKNEIYAYLQHYHNKSNRMVLVTEELLGGGSQSESQSQPILIECDGVSNDSQTPKLKKNKSQTTQISEALGEDAEHVKLLTGLEKDVEIMRGVFPDADPYYLYESLERDISDPERVAKLSDHMFTTRNYPKLKDRLDQERKKALKQRLANMEFNVQEFLQTFSDPCALFYDESKSVSAIYRLHALTYLKNVFIMMHANFIEEKFEEHKGHFTTTLRDLEKIWEKELNSRNGRRGRSSKKSNKFRKHARVTQEEMPDIPDEYFYKELLFTRHEQEIKDHIQKEEEEKRQRYEDARAKGTLFECGCCYDDEVLFEDMLPCPDGHLFCSECIKRSAEELIGQSRVHFPCLDGDCNTEFGTSILKRVLTPAMFSTLLRKVQEEEVRQAGIPDLVSCPFCSFATIMSTKEEEDKVFKCQNSDCLKESCRLCKELNHVPLRCEEVEKQGETNMRTYIENKMAEAMIRTCWKCKKRFFKIDGCNKMTCTCGASMCYVCRKPIEGYDHFNGGRCSENNMIDLHMKEVQNAGKIAREEYNEHHPEVQLKVDPLKGLPTMPTTSGDQSIRDRTWYYMYEAGGREDNDSDYSDDGSHSYIGPVSSEDENHEDV